MPHPDKHDPIPQGRDYYRFTAFFNSLEDAEIPAPLPSVDRGQTSALEAFERQQAKAQEVLAAYERRLDAQRMAALGRSVRSPRLPADRRNPRRPDRSVPWPDPRTGAAASCRPPMPARCSRSGGFPS